MEPEQHEAHKWLQQMVGEWTCESVLETPPEMPQMESKGTETVRPFGDYWIRCEGAFTMSDGDWQAIMTLGYNLRTQRFVGSFIGTMMSEQWVYDGSLDETGKILTLETDGPDFETGAMKKYRDIIEIIGENERTMTSEVLTEDGSWHPFMKSVYRRIA